MSQQALPGFRDFYPAELAQRNWITDTWRRIARRFGFVEYDGPPLEPLELYTRKSGDEIVGQLYAFKDKGDREVALRPEMTPTLARMVAARANAMRKPVRWFSMPQLFRYERQQKGRLREHFQLNVDIIGEQDVSADAELLAVAIEIMRAFGLTHADVRARVSDRRLLNALLVHAGVSAEQMPAVYAVVDKAERDARPALEGKLRGAGVADGVIERIFALAKPTSAEALHAEYGAVPELAEHFERLGRYLSYLEALGVAEWVQLDLSIVRGLAYYTGIVFELFDRKGAYRAICGGGRYDDLLQSLGGVDLPALGFGMGDVVLGEILRERKLGASDETRLDFWVASGDEVPLQEVMRVAAALRRRERSVEFALRPQALSRQLKAAVAAGANQAVILKLDEMASGAATVKWLGDGREERVQIEEWLQRA